MTQIPFRREVHIGETLRAVRRLRGYTQRDVADALGVSRREVQRWESQENEPHPIFLQILEQKLGQWILEAARLKN